MAMTFDEIVKARRSVRRYAGAPLEAGALEAVLEAGRLAPSARNGQSWHFTAVLDAPTRKLLAEACAGQQMVAEAPCALVVWADADRTMQCGQSAASVDCSIALAFMVLKATELGLGTCWLGAFDAGAVKRVLGLPAGAAVVAVTPLGPPAEQPAPRPRKPLAEVADIRGSGE